MQTAKLSDFTAVLKPPAPIPSGPPALPPDEDAQRKARAALYAAAADHRAAGQGRNTKAYLLSAQLREKFGLAEADRLEILRLWNAGNRPPLDDAELAQAVRNPDRYAKRPAGAGLQPGRLQAGLRPEPADKPLEALPLIRLSGVQAESVSWQWPNRFPAKSINLIPGQGAAGKTTFAAYLMACLTTGRDWADCPNTTPPGTCLFIGDEDDLASCIRPKLDAAGADAEKVVALDYDAFFKTAGQSFSLDAHAAMLDKTIADIGDVRAVFFDPLNGYLGRINSYNDGQARSVLIPLQNIAKQHNIAIYGLCHLNKKCDLSALERVLGSVAFVNTSRATWFITWDKKTDIRYLTCEKSNYTIHPTNLSFRIIDGACSFLEGTTDKTADAVLQAGRQQSDGTLECIEWLRKKL
ncbi:MAG TPA: AAA family ATPase, partial [Anaerohalosphaeraceae bacterium]|nr:AAA family ATPase [Anaerohalosphaeraceae bacterium]